MAELLHAYNQKGDLVKTQERKSLLKEVRDYSYVHGDANLAVPVFHLMLVNPKGELYIVQRGDKPENPLLYDKTVGGHVKAGESYVASLIREADEEIGVHAIITNMMDYRDIVNTTDLTKHAVIRAVDFDPWSKSIRGVKGGNPWTKRDRAVTFVGTYDGPVVYKDGEAVGYTLITPEKLREEMKKRPGGFTFDLEAILTKYWHFLK